MPSPFLQALSRGTLIFDGAMGTATHAFDLDVDRDYLGKENCPEILVRSRPELIQSVHESFFAVGSDCVETDTFGGMPHVLAEFDLAHEAFALNKAAAELARAAADKHTTNDKPRFVVGSMGPGTKLVTLGNIDWDAMFASYREQARGLLAGGVDAFIIETCQDLLQVKCVINAVLAALEEQHKTALDVPIMASVTIETTGTMLLGTEIAAAAAALAQYPICSLGLNCATGPTEMTEHVRWLGQHWGAMGSEVMREARVSRHGPARRPISIMPNAGLPVLVEGRTEFPLSPDDFARAMLDFVHRDGVGIVGGCCGTTAAHIGSLVKALESSGNARGNARTASTSANTPPTAPTAPTAPAPHEPAAPDPGVTSLYSVQEYRQDNSILIIGERMNASGSRAFKKLLEAEDWDGMVSLAREQVRHDGAHVLDINVDYAGRDNARDMAELVRRVVRQVNIPLMLDSTQVKTIEAGLKHAGGKCIINSANFEDGEHKFDQVCQLAKTYGAALVIGSIDEDKEASMARTAERKLAIAQRAYRRAVDMHGLDPTDLLFDPLVLPISTGMESDRRSGLETIEGVRAIAKAMPECQTTVGLSNCSFGLKPAARIVLNSVFLHELQRAGLTSAIIHFSKILPENRIPPEQWAAALDLIYDRRNKDGQQGFDPLQAFIELFKDADAASATKKEAKVLSLEEKLRAHIIDGEKEGLNQAIADALAKYKPLDIINDHLLDGMKTVGDLFGSGRMQLPFVLQSAEVMKMAVSLLEPHMERAAGSTKGSIVLATVKGDVHDIGKNLVDIILTNNGYTVHNIGIKQPIADIIRAWKETKANAIGLSGLLVKSVNVMEENLKELNDQGLSPHVILGGAALTRHYCEGHLRGTYKGKLFYGKDAFDGLRTMDLIMAGKTDDLDREIEDRQSKRTHAEEVITRSRIERLAAANGESPATTETAPARSDVATDVAIPRAPFLGTRVIESIDLDDVYPFINPVALFRGQWQLKKAAMSDADYDALIEDKITPMFEALKAQAKRDGILQPKVVYGYFPCNAQGDDLVIWDWEVNGAARVGEALPPNARERGRFTFPRQADKRRLCISDFFRPIDSGQVDVIAMHCVTVGHRASEAARALFDANKYTDYLYLHGLGVETAEALAEMWHKRIRQEMGIANEDAPKIRDLFTQKYRGSRYSFGYPACPRMSDQELLFALLDPSRIACTLTENWQIDPEQSTSAIIVHHPEAKYFNV